MPKSDRVRLQHMLDAAREALSFVRERPMGIWTKTASWCWPW
jgi:uncharacterized protein with HEPN domain